MDVVDIGAAAAQAAVEADRPLVIFDGEGLLLGRSREAAQRLGLALSALRPGLCYPEFLNLVKARGAYPLATLPARIPPSAGDAQAARLTCIDGLGYALNLDADGAASPILRRAMRYRQFAEMASDVQWTMDADLRFTSFNHRYAELDDYPLDVLIGMTRWGMAGVDEPEHDAFWRPHWQDLTARRPFRDFRYSGFDAKGRIRHFRISGEPEFGPDGKFLGYFGVTHDETAQYQRAAAERRLVDVAKSVAEKNSLLDLALENASNGIAFHDAEGGLRLWNRRYEELYSIPPGELRVGLTVAEIAAIAARANHSDEAQARRNAAERLAILHQRERRVFHERLGDGRIIEGTHVPLADGSSVSTYVDVTERERYQAALVEAKEAAEHADRAKTDFLANVSHELRTPLNAVIGFSETLMLECFGPLNDKQRDYLGDIQSSGKYLLSIIDDILDLTRVEAGQAQLECEPVALVPMIEHCCRMVGARFAEHGPLLRSELGADLPVIEADGRKLRQILINLLTNAFKFTPATGTVTIAARRQGEEVEIAVRDTGIGIAPADLPRVTEPFYRAEGPMARRIEGAGLGLPLAKALTALHGGAMAIESKPGSGTLVTIRLPARRAPEAQSTAQG